MQNRENEVKTAIVGGLPDYILSKLQFSKINLVGTEKPIKRFQIEK